MTKRYRYLLISSSLILATLSSILASRVNSASIVNSNSASIESSKALENSWSNYISVSPNWQKKLQTSRDRIIRELEGKLSSLARGNRGSAKIEALRVENGKLVIKVLIHHKHSPGTRFGVPLGIPYSVQTRAGLSYDPLNPSNTLSDSKLCTRGPSVLGSPNWCMSAMDIVKIVAAFI